MLSKILLCFCCLFTTTVHSFVYQTTSPDEFVSVFETLHIKSYELQTKQKTLPKGSLRNSYTCLIYKANVNLLLLITLNDNYKYLVSSILLEEINLNIKHYDPRNTVCQMNI